MMRGPVADHLVVRLADEGVPVQAIARAVKRPTAELYPVLKEAVAQGMLVALPPVDWPAGSRRDDRVPTAAHRVRAADFDDLVTPLCRVFRLQPQEARFVAALIRRADAAKPYLHIAISEGDGTDPKIVDVVAHKARRKLALFQIRFETVWGRGYHLPAASRDAILARLAS